MNKDPYDVQEWRREAAEYRNEVIMAKSQAFHDCLENIF
jgi:hypothetical protein